LLVEYLNVGALWFGLLAESTGAELAEVAVAMTGERDALGLSVTRVDGARGRISGTPTVRLPEEMGSFGRSPGERSP
jgi:hypothetical protein